MSKYMAEVSGKMVILSPQTVKEIESSFRESLGSAFDEDMREACSATKGKHLGNMRAMTEFLVAHLRRVAARREEIAKSARQAQKAREAEARRAEQAARIAVPKDVAMRDLPLPEQSHVEVPRQESFVMVNASADPSSVASVRLYRDATTDESKIMVVTTASSGDAYLKGLARAMAQAVEQERGSIEALLLCLLPEAVGIYLKLCGFKTHGAERVRQEHTLVAGFVTPDEDAVIGKAVV